MNLNEIATEVTKREGLKKSVNVAQVKEVIRIFLEEIAFYPFSEVIDVLNKHSK